MTTFNRRTLLVGAAAATLGAPALVRAQGAAERKRPRVTHEDHGGRRVEPQESEPRTHDRPARSAA